MRTLFILLSFCTATLLAEDKATELTAPLTEDGRIDFFKALEELTYPPEFATDDNGFRIFTRQFGVVKEGTSLGEFYRLQTYKKLGLDPETTPTLEFPQDTYSIIAEFYEAKRESYRPEQHGGTTNPWTLEQLPMLTDWVQGIDEPLDVIAEAIRKPVFHTPWLEPEWKAPERRRNLMVLLIPDIQLCRNIARNFQARATYRVGQGNIDGAINDKLITHRLARQTTSTGLLVPHLVGIAIEGMAMAIPLDANPEYPLTKEQIQRILAGIGALPLRAPLATAYEGERLVGLSIVQDFAVAHSLGARAFAELSKDFGLPLSMLPPPSFDWNIVYRRTNEVYDAMKEPMPKEKLSTIWGAIEKSNEWEGAARFFLSRDGMEMAVADTLIYSFFPAHQDAEEAVRRTECADNMQCLIWAIKLYQLDNGKLPDGNWAEKIATYLGGNHLERVPERYFSCPSNPSPKGKTTYALVHYGNNVPEHHETILLVELKTPVPLDKAVITVDDVLALPQKYRDSAPHPGGMNIARRSGAVQFVTMSVNESELLRWLGRSRPGE